MAEKEHEERFPPTRLSAGFCGFRKETIAGMRRNGRDAPISAIPTTTIEPSGGPLADPSLARVAGYDLMDGGDDIINAIPHGPP
jgi:hypothetical protein